MPSSTSLAAYLAKNYLTADPPSSGRPKKKKRKHDSSSNLLIADDDAPTWTSPSATHSDDESTPIVAGTSTSFRRAKSSNWIVTSKSTSAAGADADAAAADAILASNAPPPNDGDEVPDPGVVKMESGAHAGLQTADQVAAQLAKAQAAEEARFAALPAHMTGAGAETIYRDASGRIINVAMARAEARKAAQAEEEKKRQLEELQKGDVQKREEKERKRRLEEAKVMGLSRYKDDEEMNRELKEEVRWSDPALAFLSSGKEGKGGRGKKKKEKVYEGPAAPNRFGIRPGWRWDGVDRGNGFEKKWFLAQNKRKENRELRYTSMMDID